MGTNDPDPNRYGLEEWQPVLPKFNEKLRELAARLTLKGLTTEQIVKTADTLLNAGLYDDALVATIDASPSILSNVEPPFRHFLENVSIQPPEYACCSLAIRVD